MKNLQVNILFNGGGLNVFSLRSGRNKVKISALTTSIQHCIGVPDSAVRQQMEIKYTQFGKEDAKLFLFTDDMPPYVKILTSV